MKRIVDASERCLQRAEFDTKPIRKKEDVASSWTELLEKSDGGENEKPPQKGIIDRR